MQNEEHIHKPYHPIQYEQDEMLRRSEEYFQLMNERRSVRDFSDREVPIEVINNIIKTASTAPSGAHKQPWTFCVISNKELKHHLRELAEEEERVRKIEEDYDLSSSEYSDGENIE